MDCFGFIRICRHHAPAPPRPAPSDPSHQIALGPAGRAKGTRVRVALRRRFGPDKPRRRRGHTDKTRALSSAALGAGAGWTCVEMRVGVW